MQSKLQREFGQIPLYSTPSHNPQSDANGVGRLVKVDDIVIPSLLHSMVHLVDLVQHHGGGEVMQTNGRVLEVGNRAHITRDDLERGAVHREDLKTEDARHKPLNGEKCSPPSAA